MEPQFVKGVVGIASYEAITILMSIILMTLLLIILAYGYVFVRLTRVFSSESGKPDSNSNGVQEVEDKLSYIKAAQEIDNGFISAISHETRREKRWLLFRGPPRDGLCVTITIHVTEVISAVSDKSVEVDLWFEIPSSLNTGSKLERFCEYHGVPPEEPYELIGKNVPVRFNDKGEWETAWFADWQSKRRFSQSIRDRLRLDRILLQKVRRKDLQTEDDTY